MENFPHVYRIYMTSDVAILSYYRCRLNLFMLEIWYFSLCYVQHVILRINIFNDPGHTSSEMHIFLVIDFLVWWSWWLFDMIIQTIYVINLGIIKPTCTAVLPENKLNLSILVLMHNLIPIFLYTRYIYNITQLFKVILW